MILGHVDHGKTSLTSAITKFLSDESILKANFVNRKGSIC